MSNVHASSKKVTSRTNAGQGSRQTPAEIMCSGCGAGATRGCFCLTDRRLLDQMQDGAAEVFASRTDLTRRRSALREIGELLEQGEQARREDAAFFVFCRELSPDERTLTKPVKALGRSQRDRALVEFMMYDGVIGNSMRGRSVEECAELFSLPVGRVKDLRDRCLRAMERWPVAKPAKAAIARRVA